MFPLPEQQGLPFISVGNLELTITGTNGTYYACGRRKRAPFSLSFSSSRHSNAFRFPFRGGKTRLEHRAEVIGAERELLFRSVNPGSPTTRRHANVSGGKKNKFRNTPIALFPRRKTELTQFPGERRWSSPGGSHPKQRGGLCFCGQKWGAAALCRRGFACALERTARHKTAERDGTHAGGKIDFRLKKIKGRSRSNRHTHKYPRQIFLRNQEMEVGRPKTRVILALLHIVEIYGYFFFDLFFSASSRRYLSTRRHLSLALV